MQPLTLTDGAASPSPSGNDGAGGGGAASSPPPPAQPAHRHQNGGDACPHHQHGGRACCPASSAPPRPRHLASSILPNREMARRFRSDPAFRLNVLGNVVRGGPYELFLSLVAALASPDDEDDERWRDPGMADGIIASADPARLASMLGGYGMDGHTLAHWCAKRGDEPRFLSFLVGRSYEGARLLIDLHLPSRDAVGMYPLHWAVTEGAIPLVSMLLTHLDERPSSAGGGRAPSSSASGLSPLAGDGDAAGPPDGVAAGSAGIDATDSSGCTPLLIAAQYGHPDLAAFLIRRGADPAAVDSSRDTALHWAAYKGTVEVCGMLLHMRGAEGHLDGTDAFGQTPLHLASLRGNADAVSFLMEEACGVGGKGLGAPAGGRVGSKSPGPGRPGAYAARLLGMRDKEGKTPKDLAIKKKKAGCELILDRYEETYLSPRRTLASRVGRTCRDLVSPRAWRSWMGATGSDMPVSSGPTFPFYWMVSNILLAGLFYWSELLGMGGPRTYADDSLLLDRMGLHVFFAVCWAATWATLYLTYVTNPGVLEVSDGTPRPSSCGLPCGGGGGYPRDRIGAEMDSITRELRRQYDEVIDSYSRDFPSPEKRVQLNHTCRIVRPPRSKYCRVARRCILMFDHHCPFVATTIGLYNYIYFYLFLVFFCLMAVGFMVAWIMFMTRCKTFPKAVFASGLYFSLYLLPVSMMVGYHTQLVLINMTTNEQIGVRKYKYFWDENGRFRNPFDQGKIRNILMRLSPDRSLYQIPMNLPGACSKGCCGEVELTGAKKARDEEKQILLDSVV